MGLETERNDREGLVILAIAGDLTMDTYPELKNTFSGLLEGKPDFVILNLSRVETAGSSAIGALVGFLRELQGCGGQLALAAPSPMLIQVLELLKLRDFFVIYSSEDEAVADLKSTD